MEDLTVDWGVSIGIMISVVSLLIAALSALYTKVQVNMLLKQTAVDANAKIAEINRELLGLAFQDPELFGVLEDKPLESKSKQKHYIQMWLNHIENIWHARQHQFLSDANWYSLKKDIADFLSIELVRAHWNEVRAYYPPDFVGFVIELMPSYRGEGGAAAAEQIAIAGSPPMSSIDDTAVAHPPVSLT